MKLYTFIADYKGGTYISQYMAKTLEEALSLWIINVDFFNEKQLKSFKKNIEYGNIEYPAKLDGLTNAWCTCYVVLGALLLLNIIETVNDTRKMDDVSSSVDITSC
ncbi:hypothetical protein [Bacteroides sp.]|uniref:hypothetical protein n=1 Tax=Bacteroides sp. TaxID=29523 RepID=UPI0025C112AC|nr:hypothetical protein [Bacteroides sp.]